MTGGTEMVGVGAVGGPAQSAPRHGRDRRVRYWSTLPLWGMQGRRGGAVEAFTTCTITCPPKLTEVL